MSFVKFLRTPFLQNTYGRLLLLKLLLFFENHFLSLNTSVHSLRYTRGLVINKSLILVFIIVYNYLYQLVATTYNHFQYFRRDLRYRPVSKQSCIGPNGRGHEL